VDITIHYSGDKIKKNEMGGPCGTYEKQKSEYRILVVKREGKRLLGRSVHRWEDNI
jgi:hypothetical protein